MSDDWGPWIEHDGKSIPVPSGEVVFARILGGQQGVLTVAAYDPEYDLGDAFIWATLPDAWRFVAIVAYRRRRPQALRDLIDLAENLPHPVREDA